MSISGFTKSEYGNIIFGAEGEALNDLPRDYVFDHTGIKVRTTKGRRSWEGPGYRQLFLKKDVDLFDLSGTLQEVFGYFKANPHKISAAANSGWLGTIVNLLDDTWMDPEYVEPIRIELPNFCLTLEGLDITFEDLGVDEPLLEEVRAILQREMQQRAKEILVEAVDVRMEKELAELKATREKILSVVNKG